MRCADFGPTPGRQRRASISWSSSGSELMAAGHAWGQNGSLSPGGSGMPAVISDMRSCMVDGHAVDRVVDRRGYDVLEHFAVAQQGRVDFDAPHGVLAGHGDLDQAAGGLAGDGQLGQFLLGFLHFLLHFLGLLHEAGEITFHGFGVSCFRVD